MYTGSGRKVLVDNELGLKSNTKCKSIFCKDCPI
jgi:hypothetical protein